jgi:hypothetical protein
MDWKQIIGGIIIGAIIGIAGTFYMLGERTTKLETQVEHFKSQINQLSETMKESGKSQPEPEVRPKPEPEPGQEPEPRVEPEPLPLGITAGFRSPDGRYEAVKVGAGADIHYQVKEIETDRIVLTTHAEYTTPNDVKSGTFSRDSRKFAAAYHYGHAGGYTWIGIWDIETGSLLRTERRPGWTTDIYSVFDEKKR